LDILSLFGNISENTLGDNVSLLVVTFVLFSVVRIMMIMIINLIRGKKINSIFALHPDNEKKLNDIHDYIKRKDHDQR
jgi:hypothetical protein